MFFDYCEYKTLKLYSFEIKSVILWEERLQAIYLVKIIFWCAKILAPKIKKLKSSTSIIIDLK